MTHSAAGDAPWPGVSKGTQKLRSAIESARTRTVVCFVAHSDDVRSIERVVGVLKHLARGTKARGYRLKTVIVDDGSSRPQSVEAVEAGADRVVRHASPLGAAAIERSGLRAARDLGADAAVRVDSGFADSPREIDGAIREVLDDSSLLISYTSLRTEDETGSPTPLAPSASLSTGAAVAAAQSPWSRAATGAGGEIFYGKDALEWILDPTHSPTTATAAAPSPVAASTSSAEKAPSSVEPGTARAPIHALTLGGLLIGSAALVGVIVETVLKATGVIAGRHDALLAAALFIGAQAALLGVALSARTRGKSSPESARGTPIPTS